VGRGFRAPSLAERFVQTTIAGITVVPNPDLVPETGWSAELGTATRMASAVYFDAALFWTEASQYIEPIVDPTTLQIQFRNVERARLVGLDLSAGTSPVNSPLRLSLAYTFLSTRRLDTEPSEPLPFRPAHLLTLGADYGLGAVSVGADLRFMSRYESVELYAPTDPLVSPKVLDLRGSLHRGPVTARLLLANALNYIYNLVPQTLAPVRTLTLVVSWTY
jgi:iron complex outermembrane receptor protein